MSLDINKIIMESVTSIPEEKDTPVEPIEEKCNSKNSTLKKKVVVENENISTLLGALPTALSAGMGALSLRTRIRTLNEDVGELLGTLAQKGAKLFQSDTLADKVVKGAGKAAAGAGNWAQENPDLLKGAAAGAIAVPVGSAIWKQMKQTGQALIPYRQQDQF